MAYSPNSQKRYNDAHSTVIAVKLLDTNPVDARILQYINDTVSRNGLSRQAVIKKLILNQLEQESGEK